MTEYKPHDYSEVSPVTDSVLDELEKVNERLDAIEKSSKTESKKNTAILVIAIVSALAATIPLVVKVFL